MINMITGQLETREENQTALRVVSPYWNPASYFLPEVLVFFSYFYTIWVGRKWEQLFNTFPITFHAQALCLCTIVKKLMVKCKLNSTKHHFIIIYVNKLTNQSKKKSLHNHFNKIRNWCIQILICQYQVLVYPG